MQFRGPRWPILFLLCAAMAMGGCAQSRLASWSRTKEPEVEIAGLDEVTIPSNRIEELNELAKFISEAPADEQARVALELSTGIRTSQDPLVRSAILEVLATLEDSTGDTVLKAGLSDPDPDVRVTACEAWATRGGPDAVTNLSEVISSDTDVDVRLAALRALGELRDPAAVQAVGRVLDESDPALQRRAMLALRDMTGREYGGDVGAWREFVQGGNPEPYTPNIAERLRRLF